MSLSSFPKIYALGKREIQNIFTGSVEITEKIDGSQFSFGIDKNDELVFRSKGKVMFRENYEKMFDKAVEYLTNNEETIRSIVRPGAFVYAEYLRAPKHNVLKYSRVPKNNLIVFGLKGVDGNFIDDHLTVETVASSLDLETVPLIYSGEIDGETKGYEFLRRLLDETSSILGGDFGIEGLVVKNYWQHTSIGDPTICCGKYVKESFKERHKKEWKTKGNTVQEFVNSFRTEARWQKAVQHLRDKGELESDPRDIGRLMKEVTRDIHVEEADEIKNFLFKHFIKQITRKATAGLPEWYKDQLLKGAFADK